LNGDGINFTAGTNNWANFSGCKILIKESPHTDLSGTGTKGVTFGSNGTAAYNNTPSNAQGTGSEILPLSMGTDS